MQQLDEYEKKVDDLNTWIDGRMGTLDSIGGVSAKWEIEMELQKFKVKIIISLDSNPPLHKLIFKGQSLHRECWEGHVSEYPGSRTRLQKLKIQTFKHLKQRSYRSGTAKEICVSQMSF